MADSKVARKPSHVSENILFGETVGYSIKHNWNYSGRYL